MGASWFLIVTVVVLDLIAFGLAIGAERRRATGTPQHDADDSQWCQYSSDIATGLAVGGLLFLLVGQLLIAAATRCLCCGNTLKPGAARAFAIIFFLLHWITFIIAGACLLAGAAENAKHIRYVSPRFTEDLTCEAIRKDTFAAGAAFTFFTAILSIFFYLCHSSAREDSWRRKGDAGVNMTPYA